MVSFLIKRGIALLLFYLAFQVCPVAGNNLLFFFLLVWQDQHAVKNTCVYNGLLWLARLLNA